MTRLPLFALVGPTASGKTEASIPLAEAIGAEIVNIDSTLVFRGMDVWTGKPSPEQQRRITHHLLDLVDPVAPYSVAGFQELAADAIADIHTRGRRALLVGGSGLYYRAIVDGLRFPATDPATRDLLEAEAAAVGPAPLHRRLGAFDPAAAGRIGANNSRRIVRALEVAAITGRAFSDFYGAWNTYRPAAVRAAGILVPRDVLYARIGERARGTLPPLLAETRRLLDRGFGRFITSFHVSGYAEAAACLEGSLSQAQAVARIVRHDKALARRQMAWFRRDPRVRWFEVGERGAAGLVEELAEYLVGPVSALAHAAARMEA